MSTVKGLVKARCFDSTGQSKYVTVGRWLEDSNGRIACIIESLPSAAVTWTGWLNLFDKEYTPTSKAAPTTDDDAPF